MILKTYFIRNYRNFLFHGRITIYYNFYKWKVIELEVKLNAAKILKALFGKSNLYLHLYIYIQADKYIRLNKKSYINFSFV